MDLNIPFRGYGQHEKPSRPIYAFQRYHTLREKAAIYLEGKGEDKEEMVAKSRKKEAAVANRAMPYRHPGCSLSRVPFHPRLAPAL